MIRELDRITLETPVKCGDEIMRFEDEKKSCGTIVAAADSDNS